MNKITLLTLIGIFVLQPLKAQKDTSQTTYYLIRHAEKLRTNPSESDPDLSAIGILRAHKWNEVFKYIAFDEIYSTNYKRTINTSKPIADKHQLTIKTYNSKTIDYKLFKESTQYKTVLIVGHSNTIPDFVNALIEDKKYVEIDDSNNSNLYIVTIKNGHIAHVLIHINIECYNE